MSMPKDEIIKRLNVMESFINNIAGPWLWFRHFRNPWHSIKSIYLKKKSNLTGPSWHCGVDTPIILCTLWVQFRVKALGCVVASRKRAAHRAVFPTFVRICCVAPEIQIKISQRKIRKRLLRRSLRSYHNTSLPDPRKWNEHNLVYIYHKHCEIKQ